MPIYEYRCEDCAKDSSILVRSPKTAAAPQCEHCGSAKVSRKISAVARKRSVGDVVGEYGSDLGGGSIRDPRQVGHWVEKRFEQFGSISRNRPETSSTPPAMACSRPNSTSSDRRPRRSGR